MDLLLATLMLSAAVDHQQQLQGVPSERERIAAAAKAKAEKEIQSERWPQNEVLQLRIRRALIETMPKGQR